MGLTGFTAYPQVSINETLIEHFVNFWEHKVTKQLKSLGNHLKHINLIVTQQKCGISATMGKTLTNSLQISRTTPADILKCTSAKRLICKTKKLINKESNKLYGDA
jgi:hypothetical protein